MTPAAAAILGGMPDPSDLRRAEHGGITYVSAGSALLSCYPSADAGMRNVAVAVLRQLGLGGQAVAAVIGLTENYVATLHNRALREGLPGLVRESGRPRKLAEAAWARARRWLLAAPAEQWLATRLNDYLRDPDEYRAITRSLLHLGGQISYAPAAITVTLDNPAPPRLARAVAMLLDEVNAAPPRMPGDRRPITYRLGVPGMDRLAGR